MNIREKLRIWLGVSEVDYSIEVLDDHIRRLEGLLQVGVDYSPHHRDISWAVISVKGKSEWVQFFDLGRADIQEISRFLKSYSRNNTAIDAISGMPRDLFWEEC